MNRPVLLEIVLCDDCAEAIEPALFDEPNYRVAMESIARKIAQCPHGCARHASLVRANAQVCERVDGLGWVQPEPARRLKRRG